MDTPIQPDPAEQGRPVTEDILGRELVTFRPAFRTHVARADALNRERTAGTPLLAETNFFPDSQVYDAVVALLALAKGDGEQTKRIFRVITRELIGYFKQKPEMTWIVEEDIYENVIWRLGQEKEKWKDGFLAYERLQAETADAARGAVAD